MSAPELARLISGANTALEEACSAVNLSRRAALALAIMSLGGKSEGNISNQELLDRFLEYRITTKASAPKDVSSAKSDLLTSGCVQIVGKVSVFSVTDRGREVARKFQEVLDSSINEIGLSGAERLMLRELINSTDCPANSNAANSPIEFPRIGASTKDRVEVRAKKINPRTRTSRGSKAEVR